MDKNPINKMTFPYWSVVIPIKDETALLTQSLPSIYNLNPDEVVLCFDKPANEPTFAIAHRIARAYRYENLTKFLQVKQRPDYKFHQAWVRRKGFLEARYDHILTTDVDLILNPNVYKAIALVGKNNIGFVSLQKFLFPNSLGNLWRCFTRTLLIQWFKLLRYYHNRLVSHTPFTGLYAFYRPYWLDSEDEGIKDLVNPKQKARGEHVSKRMEDPFIGEDTYLHDCMLRKHKCIYLSDVGAICLNTQLEDIPEVQQAVAIYHAQKGRNFKGALAHAILHARRHYLPTFIQSIRYLRNNRVRTKLEKTIFGGKGPTIKEQLQNWLTNLSYEPEVSKVLAKHHGHLFVDVGAGIGYYSFLLYNNFDRIIAFEPHPQNFRNIEYLKDELGYPKIEVLPFAVSNRYGIENLYVADNPPYQGQTSLDKHWVSQLNKNAEPNYICNVKTIRLDGSLRNELIVDLIKVDVEGFEWQVIEGAEDSMSKIKAWLIEVHDLTSKIYRRTWLLEKKIEMLMKTMGDYGYVCKRIGKDHLYCYRK